MPMVPDMEMSMVPSSHVRWDHIASDAEVMRAMRDHSAEVQEVPMISQSFIVSEKFLTVIRAGALGGDHREIYGGWVYRQYISFAADRQEIRTMARNPMNSAF